MFAILATFFDGSYSQYDSLRNLIDHVYVALKEGRKGRASHAIRIGGDVASVTRVARQKGALLIPDLLFKEDVIAGRTIRRFMAIEDLRDREGTECFFFRHSLNTWPYTHIIREYMWPAKMYSVTCSSVF